MELLDGKLISKQIKDEIKSEVEAITASGRRPPHLVAVLVGSDPPSQTYVRNKMRACEYVGYSSTLKRLPAGISEQDLLVKVNAFNEDTDVDGIIVQMPLPDHITPHLITQSILPSKDVDGFHPLNMGLMTQGYPSLSPATPSGVMELLKRYKIETKGKHCVVVGKSAHVGRPTSIMISGDGDPGEATVSLCHIFTPPEQLKALCQTADIIIVAVGKPGLITADMVKEGVVVVDVGITRVKDDSTKSGYALRGDVDFEEVSKKASYITPVPGGVGPMTVAILLRNTLDAYNHHYDLSQIAEEYDEPQR